MPVVLNAATGPSINASIPLGLSALHLRHIDPPKAGDRFPKPCDFAVMPQKQFGVPNTRAVVAAPSQFVTVESVTRVRPSGGYHQPWSAAAQRVKRGGYQAKAPAPVGSRQQELNQATAWVSGPGGRGGKKVVTTLRNQGMPPNQTPFSHNRARLAPKRQGEWSCEVKAEWVLQQTIALAPLSKTMLDPETVQIEDVAWRGQPGVYEKRADMVNPRTKVLLPAVSKTHVPKSDEYFEDKVQFSTQLSSLHDEMWWPMIEESNKKHPECRKVIASNELIAVLMTACHSRFSWYIKAYFVDGVLILEKDYDSTTEKFYIDETNRELHAVDDPNYDAFINETSVANDKFIQKVIHKNTNQETLEGSQDISEDYSKRKPNRLYRYRTAQIPAIRSKTPIILNYRAEIDARLPRTSGKSGLVMARALMERPIKTKKSWASQGDATAALLTGELRNNDALVNRWLSAAYLGGCEALKLGFIAKNPMSGHDLIAVSSVTEKSQIGMKCATRWGVLRSLLDTIFDLGLQDASLIILKEPNNHTLRIYTVPDEEEGSSEEKESEETK